MKVYLVGGAVRDELLGLPNADRDWVVVGATSAEMLDLGYLQVGKDFPVFLHPQTREEYALARRERKTGSGHTGFALDAAPSVTLEEDLLRRDLTINALARDSDGNLVDPHGGYPDLQQGILRHVSAAFAEDPLRVLRVARFAARFSAKGFRVADETMALMKGMSASGELTHLPAERIWRELETALREAAPGVFIEVLRECGALQVILPELDALWGVPQPEQHHPEIDTGVHTLLALQQACRLSDDPVVRYATLVHDLGKAVTPKDNWPHHYQHEHLGVPLVEKVGRRLRAPKEYTSVARLVARHHLQCHQLLQMRPVSILRLLEALDAFRRPRQLEQFVLSCEADARGRSGLEQRKYLQPELLRQAFRAASAIDINALLESRRLLPGQQSTEADPKARQEHALKIRDTVHQARTAAIRDALHSNAGDG